MNCPVCKNVVLALAERQGIEIDYCPSCRGVWLDRGELDKLIAGVDDAWPTGSTDRDRRPDRDRDDDDDRYDDDDGGGLFRRRSRGGGRKRESLLGELFEFGG